jgi:hypothetical protein
MHSSSEVHNASSKHAAIASAHRPSAAQTRHPSHVGSGAHPDAPPVEVDDVGSEPPALVPLPASSTGLKVHAVSAHRATATQSVRMRSRYHGPKNRAKSVRENALAPRLEDV